MSNISKFLEALKIFDCNMQKVRIGNKSDGGYVTLDQINKQCNVLYSLGVGDDVSFELDFVNRYPQSKVQLFDHTIEFLPENHPNFIFHKQSLGSQTEGDTISLGEKIDASLGHVILKMDIEWDEWKLLESLSEEQYHKIDQLIVEFHIIGIDVEEKFVLSEEPYNKLTPYFASFYKSVYEKVNEDLYERYFQTISNINQYFFAFHIHPNNSLQKTQVGEYSFPPLLEISFVRKDLVKNATITNEQYPIAELDYPNKPYKEELKNYYPFINKKK